MSGEDARRGIPPKCGGSDASPVGDGSPSLSPDGRAAVLAGALSEARDVWTRAGAAMEAADLTTLEGCREVSRIYDRAVREERRVRLGLPVDPKTAPSAAPQAGG